MSCYVRGPQRDRAALDAWVGVVGWAGDSRGTAKHDWGESDGVPESEAARPAEITVRPPEVDLGGGTFLGIKQRVMAATCPCRGAQHIDTSARASLCIPRPGGIGQPAHPLHPLHGAHCPSRRR